MKKVESFSREVANNILLKCEKEGYIRGWKRFHHCNAWISECYLNRYFLIRSYDTIVGIIDDQQGILIELGKWSRTTSKQVTQIYNMPDYESYNEYGFTKCIKRVLVS